MSKADEPRPKMYLVPCSCGLTFAVAENYDHQGTAWSRYLKCPNCEKRHDPKNRLLQLGYERAGFWKVRCLLIPYPANFSASHPGYRSHCLQLASPWQTAILPSHLTVRQLPL